MFHNNDFKSVALNNGAGNVSTSYIDLGPGGGAHIPAGRFLFRLPLQAALADAGTVTVALMECATSGGTYTAVPGYGTMVVTGAGGAGAAAADFKMPIAAHVLQYVKAKFTQVGAGNNSVVSANFAVEL